MGEVRSGAYEDNGNPYIEKLNNDPPRVAAASISGSEQAEEIKSSATALKDV